MHRFGSLISSGVLIGSAVVVAACGSGSNNNHAAATVAPAAGGAVSTQAPLSQSQALTPVAAAASQVPVRTPTPAALNPLLAATPATNPTERVNGTVQSVSGSTVSLKEGGSFTTNSQTSVTKLVASSLSALQPGQIVAVTAKQQPDNTLLASIIRIFPPSTAFRLGQSPLDGGDLMTNATVDKVSSNGFSVTFPGGGAQVTLAPGAQIMAITDGTVADITPGASVSASVQNGVARSVSIQ